MQQELNHTVQSLLGQRNLSEISQENISNLILKYPYCAILHLLNSKKLQLSADHRYADSVSETALYFTNPHWLNHQLSMQQLPEESPVPLKPWHEPLLRSLETESTNAHSWEFTEDQPESPELISNEEKTVAEPISTEEKPVHEPIIETPAAQTEQLPFEPLYTIDYFASQGIQLSDAEKQDQLGKRLKSFTDWLKTMKKVHPEKKQAELDIHNEDHIKEVAEHSNEEAEVLTEAMAEVYLKQGLTRKAIDVYEKLSLLNPSFSGNFAAKIAQLKEQNT